MHADVLPGKLLNDTFESGENAVQLNQEDKLTKNIHKLCVFIFQ